MNTNSSRRVVITLAGLMLLAVLVVVWALQVGSSDVSLGRVIQALYAGHHDSLDVRIFLDLRLPRVVAAFCVGGLLGVSGLLMQVLLRNPLADPYILGVSGGAGLGGIALVLLLPALLAPWLLPVGAALGALCVVVLVFGLSGISGVHTMERLLLTGVAVSSLCTALVSLLLTFSTEGTFRGLVFWLLGELNGNHFEWLFGAWCLLLVLAMPMARVMNIGCWVTI
jgi:iron complex transport system permease protein